MATFHHKVLVDDEEEQEEEKQGEKHFKVPLLGWKRQKHVSNEML